MFSSLNSRQKRNLVMLVFFIFVICFLGYYSSIEGKYDIKYKASSVKYLGDRWDIVEDRNKNTVEFDYTLGRDASRQALSFYTKDAFVKVKLNNMEIYSYGHRGRFCSSPGSHWHTVKIPTILKTDRLSIEVEYVYSQDYTTKLSANIGETDDIIFSLLSQDVVDLALNVVLVIIGVCSCALGLFEKSDGVKNASNFYLGLLGLSFAFWSNNALYLNQLLLSFGFGSSSISYFNYYFTLYVIPLLVLCYMEVSNGKVKLNYLFWSHMGLVLVLTMLQFGGVAEFAQTSNIFLAYSGGELLIAFVEYYIQTRGSSSNKLLDKSDKETIALLALFLCTLFLDTIRYLFSSELLYKITYAKIGLIIYLLVQIKNGIKYMISTVVEIRNTERLKTLAFSDNLTGLGNRYAYNKDLVQIPLEDVCLVSFDINNLKYYNDNFGHGCGDKLINEAAQIISRVYSKVYRTGGDEFIAIQRSTTAHEQELLKKKLRALYRGYNDNPDNGIVVEIACGYAIYRVGDISTDDILKRSDDAMYSDKAIIKSESRVESVR